MWWVFSLGCLLCREMNLIVGVHAALSNYKILRIEEDCHPDKLVLKMIGKSKRLGKG